jgi:hypothetical protein
MWHFHLFWVFQGVPADPIELHSIIEYQWPKGYQKYPMGVCSLAENGLDVLQQNSFWKIKNKSEIAVNF